MKRLKRCMVILLVFAILFSAVRIAANYPAACEDICYSVKGGITERILASFSEYSADNEELLQSIVKCEYSENGKIKRIYADAALMNSVSSSLAREAGNAVSESENEFTLPLGNIFGAPALSGRGPGIGLKILPVGTAEYSVNSSFCGAGINQTHYRVSVTILLEYRCVAPFRELSDSIELEYIISDTVIIGDIPEVLFFGSEA